MPEVLVEVFSGQVQEASDIQLDTFQECLKTPASVEAVSA